MAKRKAAQEAEAEEKRKKALENVKSAAKPTDDFMKNLAHIVQKAPSSHSRQARPGRQSVAVDAFDELEDIMNNKDVVTDFLLDNQIKNEVDSKPSFRKAQRRNVKKTDFDDED